MTHTEESAPVFVDATGRRRRQVRRIAYAVGAACLTYTGLVGASVLGDPVRPTALAPFPAPPKSPPPLVRQTQTPVRPPAVEARPDEPEFVALPVRRPRAVPEAHAAPGPVASTPRTESTPAPPGSPKPTGPADPPEPTEPTKPTEPTEPPKPTEPTEPPQPPPTEEPTPAPTDPPAPIPSPAPADTPRQEPSESPPVVGDVLDLLTGVLAAR